MSDYESRVEDARREQYEMDHEGECLSGDPFCARNPRSAGTYEAYSGALCGDCEEREGQPVDEDEEER